MAVGPGAGAPVVPANHTVHTLMIAGRGMRDTFVDYGDAMMAFSGAKSREILRSTMKSEITLSHLGYSTTGCYQYNPCVWLRLWQRPRLPCGPGHEDKPMLLPAVRSI